MSTLRNYAIILLAAVLWSKVAVTMQRSTEIPETVENEERIEIKITLTESDDRDNSNRDAEFSQVTMLGFGLGIPFAFVLILLAVACKPSSWTCRHFRDRICTRLGCVQPLGMEIYRRKHQKTASNETIEEIE